VDKAVNCTYICIYIFQATKFCVRTVDLAWFLAAVA
jgi:hypothetical protein